MIDIVLAREIIEDVKQISYSGSTGNKPPEIWEQKYGTDMPQRITHFKKFDLWSLGCCVYQLLTGNYPFLANDYHSLFFETLKEGKYMIECDIKPSQEIIDFIQGLLQRKPKNRFTWEEVLNHPFIKNEHKDLTPYSDEETDIILSIDSKIQFKIDVKKNEQELNQDQGKVVEPVPQSYEPIPTSHSPTAQPEIQAVSEISILSDSRIEELLNIIYVEEIIYEKEIENGFLLIGHQYNIKEI